MRSYKKIFFKRETDIFEWALGVGIAKTFLLSFPCFRRHQLTVPDCYFKPSKSNICWSRQLGTQQAWFLTSIWGVGSAVVRLDSLLVYDPKRGDSVDCPAPPQDGRAKQARAFSVGQTWNEQKHKRKWVISNSVQEDHWDSAERRENNHSMPRGLVSKIWGECITCI